MNDKTSSRVSVVEQRRECPACGRVFSAMFKRQVYCGSGCGFPAGRTMQTGNHALVLPAVVTCVHCCREFRRKSGGWRNWRFCSRDCYFQSRSSSGEGQSRTLGAVGS